MSRKRQAIIFVDPLLSTLDGAAPPADGDQRLRTSFLHRVLDERSFPSTEVSVFEYQQRLQPVDIEGASHILISWDASNGDGGRHSDSTMQFFRNERVRLAELLDRQGTIVFCECQTIEGLPVQAAYDAIYGRGELEVLDDVVTPEYRRGIAARHARLAVGHPLLTNVYHPVEARYYDEYDDSIQLFHPAERPRKVVDELSPQRPLLHFMRDSLYCGWFTAWKKGWVPILFANLPDNVLPRLEKPAILLAKVTGNGVMVASTLWIAGYGQKQLILNVLSLDNRLAEVRRVHNRVARRRRIANLLTTVLLMACAVGLAWVLVEILVGGWASSLPASGLISAVGITVLSISNLILVKGCRSVWNRPYGVGVLRWWARLAGGEELIRRYRRQIPA